MRGDSLRDFYAKALALVGLGMLAGAGAVVDYWPATVDVPRVARTPQVNLPEPVRLASVPSPRPISMRASLPIAPVGQPGEPLPRSLSEAAAMPSMTPAATIATAEPVPVPRSFAALETPVPLVAGESIALAAAPAMAPVAMPAAETVAVELEPIDPPVQRDAPAAAALRAGAAPPPDGFFSGALKKTGASIVKGGAATGASIADAFRSVFGAFKKVSPFAPDTQLARPGL